jgi:hypothetical protein
MKDMGLIRKIAWSFHRSTGLPVEDLIAEASLAYVEWSPKFDQERGTISTFMYPRIRCHLVDYCKKQYESRCDPIADDLDTGLVCPDENTASQENRTAFKQALQNSPEEVKYLAWMIFQSPGEFLGHASRGKVKDKLREHGWTWSMIWRTFAEVKNLLKETA